MSPGRVVPAGPAGHEQLLGVYSEAHTVAVVGASAAERKPAHYIPRYLKGQGYTVIPVNPSGGEILGAQVHSSLADVPEPVDVVEVFRPPAEAEDVARQAVSAGAKVLWFQPGTHTDEAVRIASEAGLTVVADRCMGVAHGELGLGPGPERPVAGQSRQS